MSSRIREGFSTTDNLFILHSLIEIIKSNKSKLFCAFIDFKQAFDTVWRNGLWSKLMQININGKCLRFMINMYTDIKSRITTSEGTPAFLPCLIGLRHGEYLSPLLFSIHLSDLRHYLDTNMVPGKSCETNEENLNYYSHYENTPIQIYRKFHFQKLKSFRLKTLVFFIFMLKT